MTPADGSAQWSTASASAAASPSALRTRINPASRAAAAVCGPTAKTGTSRALVRAAKARTPLALVARTAWTPASGNAAPSLKSDRQKRGQQRFMADIRQAARYFRTVFDRPGDKNSHIPASLSKFVPLV